MAANGYTEYKSKTGKRSCIIPELNMNYLCMAIGVLGAALFGYVFMLDRQIKDMNRRLNARDEGIDE